MDASSWMKLGQIGSSATSVLPNWYDLDNSENSKDLNEALYGDSTQDPMVRLLMGHNNAMQNVLSQVNSNVTDYSDYRNNTSLENAWDPNALQSNVNADFGWSNIADNLQATATGASYGAQLGGGWGALIGAGVGMLSNIGSQIGYKNRVNRINNAVDRANQQTTDSFYNTAKSNQTQMMRDYFMHTPYAEGGSLEEQNGVTKFNVGGTHSQNPYDGIQQGIASDGLPNMVEEGELKYNDYVYSARLKPSKSLLKQYNLPEKYAGKTFAEIGDKLQQESKDRPNDPISKTTLDEWMLRLQNAQEEYKAKAEERRLARVVNNMSDEEKAALLSSLEQPMAQQEGIDLSQPMYAKGGKIYIKPENRGKFTALKKRTGKSASWFKAHGTPAQKKMATFALNARKWKHEDGGHLAQRGMYLDIPPYADTSSPYYGLETIEPEVSTPIDLNIAPLNIWKEDSTIPLNLQGKEELNNDLNAAIQSAGKREFGDMTDDQIDTYLATQNPSNKFNLANLRYAPAVGAGIGALTAMFQPKDYTLANDLRQLSSRYKGVSAPHIGGYRRYTPYDVNLGDAENLALQAQALAANRGQNRATQGALNTAVIAKSQEANAKRNLAAQQANEANRLAIDTYNLGIDQFNAQRDSQYDQLNQQILNNKLNMLSQAAQAADASRTAWAANINSTTENAFNQLGNVGKDQWVRNQRDALLTALGAEGIKELMKSAEGRVWLTQNGYYNS